MTEKNYNPEQKHAKAAEKMGKMDKPHPNAAEQKKVETPKTESAEKKEEIKMESKPEVKKAGTKKVKKTEAVVRGLGIPISSKQSFAISKFIKNKEITKAIRELEEILLHRRALPMKGEIPHRKGPIMSGRYPRNALREFVKLLKSLNANANVNEISNPIIVEAYGNFASRPYGKSGRVRKKRSNIMIMAKEESSPKSGQSKEKMENKKQ